MALSFSVSLDTSLYSFYTVIREMIVLKLSEFVRRNGRTINNVAVVLVVLLAIYVKVNDENARVLFSINDVYIIAGAFLAFAFLFMLKKRKQQ